MDKNYKNYRVEFDGFGIENMYSFLILDRQRRDYLRKERWYVKDPDYRKEIGEFFLTIADAKKLDKFGSAEIYYLIIPDAYTENYPDGFMDYANKAIELNAPIMVRKGQKIFTNEATPRSHLMFLFDDNDAPQTASNETQTTTAPPVQPKEKISKYQERDNDFMAWLESENPLLDKMTKSQIHARLIARNGQLWRSGFKDWWGQQNIYKATRGRKPTTNR